jgi:hypothetical protein
MNTAMDIFMHYKGYLVLVLIVSIEINVFSPLRSDSTLTFQSTRFFCGCCCSCHGMRGRDNSFREQPARGVSHIPGRDSMTEPDTNKQSERERERESTANSLHTFA